MRKEIKAYGNSNVITFTKEECKLHGTDSPLEKGDVIDFIIIKHEKGKTKNEE